MQLRLVLRPNRAANSRQSRIGLAGSGLRADTDRRQDSAGITSAVSRRPARAAVRPEAPPPTRAFAAGDVLVGMHIWETISLENVAYILDSDEFRGSQPVKFYILRGARRCYGHLQVSARNGQSKADVRRLGTPGHRRCRSGPGSVDGTEVLPGCAASADSRRCASGRATMRPCCGWRDPDVRDDRGPVDRRRRLRVGARSIRGARAEGAGGKPQRSGGDGREPVAALASLALPRPGGRDWPRRSTRACCRWPSEYDVASRAATPTVGRAAGHFADRRRRSDASVDRCCASGGQPGDASWSRAFGGSILGRHLDFPPRVREALRLRDAIQTARRHRRQRRAFARPGAPGRRERLRGRARTSAVIPIAPAAQQLAEPTPRRPHALDHALGDGEDFELILAVPPAEASGCCDDQPLDVPLTDIGQLIPAARTVADDSAGRREAACAAGIRASASIA